MSAIEASSRIACAAVAAFALARSAPADMTAGAEAAKRRDFDTAFAEFMVDAEAGNSRAQALIANMYRRGWGTARDPEAAVTWYRRAADGGDATAQYNLAVAYRDAVGVPRDEVAATRWFGRAAGQGMPEAQLNLGIRLAEGRGAERDLVRGYAWLSRAVAGGSPAAMRVRKQIEARMTPEQVSEGRLLGARSP